VGNPILDAVEETYDRAALRAKFGLLPHERVIALLPGSRAHEVQVLMPILLDAAEKLARHQPGTQFLLAQASTIQDNLLQPFLQRSRVPVTVVKEQSSEVLAVSDFGLVKSGTAILQAAVVGTPMVLLYQISSVEWWIASFFKRVEWIGLVNLVAGRSVVPELVQSAATGQRLYEEAVRILDDRVVYDEMKRELAKVRTALGEPGASKRAAEAVLAGCRV
jgi:lipid-A-disaccharide synthase